MKYLPLALVLAASPLAAQSFLFNVNNGFIPDNDGTGLVDARTVVTTTPGILSLEVRVNIAGVGAGAYNGDLYLTLQHGSGFTVLLNRPGVTALDPFGSPDNGFNVTFAATGTQGDIHNYRSILGTDENTILEPVTGRWEPDARFIDPGLVLETTPRVATFDSFTGIDPNGTWTLFAADMATGGLARLDSWELIITPVPEPGTTVLVGALALGVFGVWRRWRR
jgi:subtilisin-like proprotein convertase family protein